MTVTVPLTIRAVTSLEELKGLASEWEQLLRTVTGHGIFLTWEWMYLWTKHFLGSDRLWILLFLDNQNRLVGIAPFYLRTIKIDGLIPIRELRFLGSEAVCSAYLDIIAREGDKPAVCRTLYRYLFHDARREWDLLILSDVPAESSTLDHWNALIDEAGKVGEIVATSCCPVVRLSEDVAVYRAGLGRTRRYSLRRKKKSLRGIGEVRYVCATSSAEVGAALDIVITLHQRRWNHDSSGGVFASDTAKRFHREVVQVLSERGRVILDLLMVNDRPIAGLYGFVYDGVYYFYLAGFDPTGAPKASPGLLLLYHRIEESILDGYRTVDLLHGTEPYKLEWATGLRRSVNSRYYNRHIRALSLKLWEAAKQAAKIVAR